MSDTTKNPEITEESTLDAVTEVSNQKEAENTHQDEKPSRSRSRERGGRRNGRGGRRNGIREEVKEFQEEILSIDRVTRVTAGGRQLRFRVALVIGDGKGRVGLGLGKAGEVQWAIEKALRDARKNLLSFPIVDGTIAHDVTVHFKSSAIFIHPAHPGTGIIAGGSARKVFAVAGIKDIIAKQHGSPNTITNTRVTLKALASLKPADKVKSFTASKEAAPKKETKKKVSSKGARKTTKKSAE